ncbi:FAD-dependent oxidoreductase, partial [Acinetobacter ursingii]|uniref:FAD-dependent oxidoreductase n=1 Tax=Acinetobacter ursingii TaxID=108980 RepID=UPI003AF6A2F0
MQLVTKNFKTKGVDVITGAMAKESIETDQNVTVKYEVGGKEEQLVADYVMVTVGRRPNTDDMGLEQAGI